MPESQFNYLFTLKNAHLSSNSYNFRTQPNIPMKFAIYVAWILFCKLCKFGEKIYYNSGDIEFFLGDYFFLARPVCCWKYKSSVIWHHWSTDKKWLNTFLENWKCQEIWQLSGKVGELSKSRGIVRENLVRENCLLLTSCLGQHQCLFA